MGVKHHFENKTNQESEKCQTSEDEEEQRRDKEGLENDNIW